MAAKRRNGSFRRGSMSDPRASYWLEARQNIKESYKYDKDTKGYWLNLAVAGLNALMASAPDSVMEDVMVEMARRERLAQLSQRTVQRKIKKDLQSD